MSGGTSFQYQRGFHNRYRMRVAVANLFHPTILLRYYGGMDDPVQFFDPRGYAEGRFGQFGPIHTSVGIQDAAAEPPYDFLVHRLTRLHQTMRDGICLDDMRPQCREHLGDDGLPAGDASRQAHFQQANLAGDLR
jgi:hypothetical protein